MQQVSKSSDGSRNRHIKSCALIAGAVALAPAAHADIMTVQVNQVLTNGGTYDLNASGGPDLTFAVTNGFSPDVDVTGGSASYALDTVTLAPLASQPGDTIGPSNTFATAQNTLASCKILVGCSGEFPSDGSTQYLGFEFSPGGGTDYGYIDLSVTPNKVSLPQLTLESFTYDDSGDPITIAAVPEPASFALLAAGAAGIAALRARRKARR